MSIRHRVINTLQDFLRLEAAGGILLIIAAIAALVAANSPLEEAYEAIRQMPVQVRIGALDIDKPALLWINDGLMAIFFLLVALEIKREALTGELAGRDALVLPLACAAGGVVVPALLFTAFNNGDAQAMRGWAVPAATDIAFALGVLSLLGSRVPVAMKLLLSTIAVVDDLIAILIIAFFYSHGLSLVALGWAAVALGLMVVLNRRHVTALTPYLLLGVVLWVCVLKSGVHATLAGVATGLLIPHVNTKDDVDDASEHSPLEWLEHALHPWVAYAILPLFAFVNAGLLLDGIGLADFAAPITLGVIVALVVGKPVGIVGLALLLRAVGWVRLPQGMTLGALVGLGILCGIGFTMSLFIASLGYSDAGSYSDAVLGILFASLVAAVGGLLWLRMVLPARAR